MYLKSEQNHVLFTPDGGIRASCMKVFGILDYGNFNAMCRNIQSFTFMIMTRHLKQ